MPVCCVCLERISTILVINFDSCEIGVMHPHKPKSCRLAPRIDAMSTRTRIRRERVKHHDHAYMSIFSFNVCNRNNTPPPRENECTPYIQTLEILKRPGSYEKLEALSKRMVEGILAAAKEHGHDACGGYIRGMFGFYFNKGPVANFTDAAKSDSGVCMCVCFRVLCPCLS